MTRLVVLAALLTPVLTSAQEPTPPADHPADRPVALVPNTREEVRAAIGRLFDAMRAGDSTALRAAFHPEARLMRVVRENEQHRLEMTPVDEFVRLVGTPHDEVYDERVDAMEIMIDDGLATAWMDYRFFVGERFSHCGVNAFQMVRSSSGWQVISLVDTAREGCE